MTEGKIDYWAEFDSKTRDDVVRMLMGRPGLSRAQAEDAVTDAFLRIMRLGAKPRSAKALLFTTAMHLVSSARQRESRMPRVVSLDEVEPPGTRPLTDFGDGLDALDLGASPSDRMERREQALQVRNEIDRLAPRDRKLLTAYYLNDTPVEELADEAGVSPQLLKRRLNYAVDRLKRSLTSGPTKMQL